MTRSLLTALGGAVCLACSVCGSLTAQEAPAAPERTVQDVLIQQLNQVAEIKNVPRTESGTYWIGVEINNTSDALRSQLNLEGGVLVQGVLPDSPAAKAGLQKHDILLTLGEHRLLEAHDLLSAVESVKTQQSPLKLMRGGKEMKLTVTPAERPQGPQAAMVSPSGRVLQLHAAAPGMLLYQLPPIPGNVSINIQKEGNRLAKVVVTRDEERWELTENELEKLPADLRPHVARMLRNDHVRVLHAAPGVPALHAPPGLPGLSQEVSRREHEAWMRRNGGYQAAQTGPDAVPNEGLQATVQQLQKSLEALRKEVQQLQEKGAQKEE